jgi:hypothetical protein
MLRSKDAHVRRAAFTLLEASNPRLRRDSGLFIETIQFIWDANPSYEVYQEFSKRHFVRRYKVPVLNEKSEHRKSPLLLNASKRHGNRNPDSSSGCFGKLRRGDAPQSLQSRAACRHRWYAGLRA